MCINEAECSYLENENQGKRSPEELFAEILKSINEYTTEKAEVLLLNKSKLLTILRSYRPLKMGNYIYGLSLNLLKKKRLIVFEWNDKRMIREYSYTKRPNIWSCRECFRLNDHRNSHRPYTYLYLVNGIVFVSVKHDCVPRDYKLVMQYQKFLDEGDTSKARSMSRTINFGFGQDSFANVVNFVEHFSASLPKPSTIDTNTTAALSDLKRKLNDNECVSTAENIPANKKNKKSFQRFQLPSTSELQQICKKLEIKYSKEANGFWKEIKFKEIDPSSKNISTQKFKTKNFYKLLSNFFTGRFCDYQQIYFAINSAFCDKLSADGEIPVDEINLLCSSYTVTEKHLKFITKFIPCRIMIFDSEKDTVKKYGKWKNANNQKILTFVLSFSKKKYSVVINL